MQGKGLELSAPGLWLALQVAIEELKGINHGLGEIVRDVMVIPRISVQFGRLTGFLELLVEAL